MLHFPTFEDYEKWRRSRLKERLQGYTQDEVIFTAVYKDMRTTGGSTDLTPSPVLGDLFGNNVVSSQIFESIGIPQGSFIEAATLAFAASFYTGTSIVEAFVSCEDEDTATAAPRNPALLAETTPIYLPPGTWPKQGNPDIFVDYTSSVQAVINRVGWAAGNDICLFQRPSGSATIAQNNATTDQTLTIRWRTSE